MGNEAGKYSCKTPKLAVLLSSEESAALPKMNGPYVFLNPCSCAQYLPTVFPQAFEHHLHGVLEVMRK